MESIPAPFPAWRPSDMAFGDDGTMYAIAMTEGQIWRARTPPVGHPEQIEWQRFASGLYHPIGLAIVDGRIFVAQKPEITELIDRDGDGIVDQFRTVATGWGLSTGWHEYCFGLAVDPQKNLWFALNTGYFWTNPGYVNPGRWRGSVMRVRSHNPKRQRGGTAHNPKRQRGGQNTEKLEVMAKGCRVPNGIAQGPDGGIFFTDNQGDWIQACKLAHVVPGRFYGHPEYKEDALPSDKFPDGKSALWFPYERGRSVSGPLLDTTQGKFGPFADQMFVGDVGYGANPGILRVALEKVNGEYQGACFRFVDGQPLGCQRMRFGPDNQLYMTSLTSGLTRMAYTGEPPLAIQSVRIRPKGVGLCRPSDQAAGREHGLEARAVPGAALPLPLHGQVRLAQGGRKEGPRRTGRTLPRSHDDHPDLPRGDLPARHGLRAESRQADRRGRRDVAAQRRVVHGAQHSGVGSPRRPSGAMCGVSLA